MRRRVDRQDLRDQYAGWLGDLAARWSGVPSMERWANGQLRALADGHPVNVMSYELAQGGCAALTLWPDGSLTQRNGPHGS